MEDASLLASLSWFFAALFDGSLWSNKGFWSGVMRAGVSWTMLYGYIGLVVALLVATIVSSRIGEAVRGVIDGVASKLGRWVCWFALIMVVQQILVVFMQAIFKTPIMSIAPFGVGLSQTPQWFGEELRLYNALLIALGSAFTFLEGGHVRVDLIYGGVSFRVKRAIDLFGSLFFMMPLMMTIYFFSWGLMWRSIASSSVNPFRDSYRWRGWQLEASTNPSGFNEVYLYKILIFVFAVLMLFQALSMALRCIQELKEGEPEGGDPQAIQH